MSNSSGKKDFNVIRWLLGKFGIGRRITDRFRLGPSPEPVTVIGNGYALSDEEKVKRPITIPDSQRKGHMWFFGTTGVGKAVGINTGVHTPNGWRKIGDIKVGDIVHAPDGKPARVLGVYPQGVRSLYKLTFEDGRTAEADGDHLWEIHHKHWSDKYHKGESRAGETRPRILTTLELKAQIERFKKGKFAVRLVKNIEKPKNNLPIEPYVIGCLLGDGYMGGKKTGRDIQHTCLSDDVLARFASLLPENTNFRIDGFEKYAVYNIKRLKEGISSLGLLGCRSWEKFIPEEYLESSLEDRMELLRGLLDKGRYVSKTGVVQYSTSSPKLAEDVQMLVWSLGGICNKKTKIPHYTASGEYLQDRDNYVLTIKYPEPQDLLTRPFRLNRVSEDYQYKDSLKLGVKSIEYSREDECVCIMVDEPDGLYVIDNYVVTHNTNLIANMIIQDIQKGYSVIAIDPKGDIELFERIIQTAEECDRLDDVLFVSPIFPELSNSVDPMEFYFMPEELVGHVVSSIEAGRDPFFRNVAKDVTSVIVRSFDLKAKAEGVRPSFSLLDIKNAISQEALAKLRTEVSNIELPDALQLGIDLDQIIKKDAQYYAKINSSLSVTLSELSGGNIGKVVGATTRNHIIERLESGRSVIAVAQLGSLVTREAAFTVGKMLISTLQSFIGRVYASGRKIDPMLCIYIDEAQNVLYHGIDDLFAKARGAGVAIHGFSQSANQLWAELGRDYGNVILDNTNTKGFMKMTDNETAVKASDMFGIKGVYNTAITSGISASLSSTPMVPEEAFLNLPNRVFYLRTYSGTYKCKTLDSTPLKIAVDFPQVPVYSAYQNIFKKF